MTNVMPDSQPSNAFVGDDWGSLDFNPYSIGEYKINSLDTSKVASISPKQTYEAPKKNTASWVENKDNTLTYTTNYDTYEASPSSKEMTSLYAQGFKLRYNTCEYEGNVRVSRQKISIKCK